MKCPDCGKDNKPYWISQMTRIRYYKCECGKHYNNKDRKGTLNDEGK